MASFHNAVRRTEEPRGIDCLGGRGIFVLFWRALEIEALSLTLESFVRPGGEVEVPQSRGDYLFSKVYALLRIKWAQLQR